MVDRPALVMVAPVMPASTGNGLAMRAGLTLDALAGPFAVHLLVVPVAGGPIRPSPYVKARTESVVVEALGREPDPLALAAGGDPGRRLALLLAWPKPLACRFATATRLQRLAGSFPGVRPAAVHVVRLYMAPYAAPFLEQAGSRAPVAVLDLDEDEVGARERIAAVRADAGDLAEARIETREAARLAELERHWLGRFARVLVASGTDRDRVAARHPELPLAVIPNAVRLPPTTMPAAGARGPARILFVGSFGYFPNVDAALFLAREVLPLIRAGGREVHLRLVGADPPPSLLALRRVPGVEVAGAVADLAPCYRDCDLVVVPVRAGGGTRIKLLEALAHARPVVATRLGAEGLEVEDGRHLLLADEPAQFASACLTLLGEPALARSLAEQGHELVRARYAGEVVAGRLAGLYRSILAGSGEDVAHE